MMMENKSRFWGGKKTTNVTRLTGYILSKGGIARGSARSLAGDYAEILQGLRIPGFVNSTTGRSIEDIYQEAVAEGVINEMDEEQYRDPAEYLISMIERERHYGKPYFADPNENYITTMITTSTDLGDEFIREED